MRLVSSFIVLSLGPAVVALVPGGAAEQPCAGLLTVQDVTSLVGPGYTLAGAGVSSPKACVYTKGVIDPSKGPANQVTLTLQDARGDAAQTLTQGPMGGGRRAIR